MTVNVIANTEAKRTFRFIDSAFTVVKKARDLVSGPDLACLQSRPVGIAVSERVWKRNSALIMALSESPDDR